MQTGLLAFAIALILALIAALAGPHLVDWNAYRPQFETELSRVLAAPVRIAGDLDARLLPSPSLRLRDISVGAPQSAIALRAVRFDIEFSLGALLRGEWRASELTMSGVDAHVRIARDGGLPVQGPSALDLSGVSVDRLNASGRVALTDEASGKTIAFDDATFAGDLRAASGSLRGEGVGRSEGRAFQYRISAAPATPQDGTRLRLNFETVAGGNAPGPSLAGDADGVFAFIDGAPHFEGQVSLSRPAGLAAPARDGEATLALPWRVRAQAKGGAKGIRFENFELLYGAENTGVRLTGLANLQMGATPKLEAVLSARQIDLDRLVPAEGEAPQPGAMLSSLASRFAAMGAPPMPLSINASIDTMQMGARPLRNIGLDLRADGKNWFIDKLELQAPGGTQMTVSGTLEAPGDAPVFNGAASIDSSDAASFASWIGGHEVGFDVGRALKASARVTLDAERVAIENLTGNVKGANITGAVILSRAVSAGAKDGNDQTRAFALADIALRADDLDLEALNAAMQGFGLTRASLPGRVKLDVQIAKANWRELAMQSLALRSDASAGELVVEHLSIADIAGIALDGSGKIDLSQATGGIALSAKAAQMEDVVRLLAPLSPSIAARLRASAGNDRDITANLNLDVARKDGGTQEVGITFAARSASLQARLNAATQLAGGAIDLMAPAQWPALPVKGEAELSAKSAPALLAMLGLPNVIDAGKDEARFSLALEGASDKPLQVEATLQGANTDARMTGTLSIGGASGLEGALKLDVVKADIAPLAGASESVPAQLSARGNVSGARLSLDELDATIAGTRLRGKLAIHQLLSEPSIDGDIGMEQLSLGPVVATLAGAPRGSASADAGWSREPFGRGFAGGWRGRIGFVALSASLGPSFGGLSSRPFRGEVRSDGATLHFTSLGGEAGGGTWEGKIDVTRKDALAVSGELKLEGVDAAQWPLMRDALRGGRLSGDMTFQSAGRSPAALIGSINGTVNAKVSGARLARLNPNVFTDVIAQADTMGRIDNARVARAVEQSLDAADFVIGDAAFSLSLRAGRLYADSLALALPQAKLTLNGAYELVNGTVDARLRLEGVSAAPDAAQVAGTGAPTLSIGVKGATGAATRTIDTSAFTAWLTVRAVDRETRRLEQLEKERALRAPQAPPVAPPASPSPATAPSSVPAPATAPNDTGARAAPSAPNETPAQPAPNGARVAPTNENPPPASAPPASDPSDIPAPNAIAVPEAATQPAPPQAGVPMPARKPKPRPRPPVQAAPSALPPLPPPIELRPAPGLFR